MSDKKLLLITFDYELFLGDRSGTVRECLTGPTDELLEHLNKCGFKAVFFIDTVYMLRLKKMAEEQNRAKSDLGAITDQLIRMVKNGHEIQPHIHPHWLDAVYKVDSNEWDLSDKRRYTFASLSPELRTDLFDHSVAFIRSVVEMANGNQPIDSYRAGGWSIQPFENFRPHFGKHDIRNEFSVIPGRFYFSDAHQFDFRKAPIDKMIYRFSDDVCIYESKGHFMEWTISSLPMTKMQQWLDFKISGLLRRLGITRRFTGSTINAHIQDEGDLYSDKNISRQIASFEGLNPYRVMRYQRILKKENYFHFISHPKLIGRFELKMIGLLFRSLGKISGLETDFRKLSHND